MSSKRSNAMSKINDFATTEQIKNAGNSDEAVDLFLHGPTAPGTTPTTTKKTISSTVADQTDSETVVEKGDSPLHQSVNEIVGVGQDSLQEPMTGYRIHRFLVV